MTVCSRALHLSARLRLTGMKLLAFLLLFATLAPAQIQNPAKDTAGGDPMVDLYRSLADHFRLSERAIYAIRDKVGSDAEIAAVLVATKRSSASPNQVIEARKSGKDWPAILKQYKVQNEGGDWVEFANIHFLSKYHGRPESETKALRAKGLDWIAINQEFRRDGRGSTR